MANYIMLDESNFDETIKSGVTAVDFFATWCMPCKMMSPVIDELAFDNADKAVVAKLDIDRAESIAMRYHVESVPTIILFKDGEEVNRIIGFNQKAKLQKAIDELL